MNAFDKLMTLGMRQSTAILGQRAVIGQMLDVKANVSPIRREERFKTDTGERFWVDVGDLVIVRPDWPQGSALPRSGEIIALADERRFRVERVTDTPAILTVSFVSLY